MFRKLLSILAFGLVQSLHSPIALGDADVSLFLGAGKPGTESFELGVGVTSLVKVRLLPSDGVDLTLLTTADQNAAGDFAIADPEELAFLSGQEPNTRSPKTNLRSVMAFKPSDVGAGASLELVARSDVPEDAVYLITKAILENAVFLEDLNLRSWDLNVDRVLVGLSLPLHAGAVRYYEEIGEANLSAETADESDSSRSIVAALADPARDDSDSTFRLHFSADGLTLDNDAERTIAEACQYATIFDAAGIQVAARPITGDASAVNSGNLASERVRYVMSALRSNVGCAATLEIVAVDGSPGQAGQVELIITLP